jgi:hypothetical protein
MNRRGKCVHCDPKLLGWTRRWIQYGYVYLAESRAVGLIKLGSCQDLGERQRTLNDHTWAGASDWRMRIYHHTIAAEMLEHDISKRLASFRVDAPYWRYQRETSTREVYRCSLRTAKRHFEAELGASAAHYLGIELQCLELG